MSNPFRTNDVSEEPPSRTDQSNEQTNQQYQPSRQINQTNQQNATTTSTSNNVISPQYSWNGDSATIVAVLGQIGFLALAHITRPNQQPQQQQHTHSESHPSSPAPSSTNQNLLQNNNNNDNNVMDANLYANLLTQAAGLYQTNPQTTRQHNHSTSAVPNHSATKTKTTTTTTTTTAPDNTMTTNFSDINDASASSNKTNDDTNIFNTNTQNTTDNNPDNSKVMFLEQDIQELSPYQCLVRKQIEVFEFPQTRRQFDGIAQGRTRPIVPGQVGIRCRHCGRAKPRDRARYAMLFPSRLIGVYQAAQNMANTHLLQTCKMIPKEIREELSRVRSRDKSKNTRKSAYGGGRQYWSDCLRVLDVIETDDDRLRFARNPPPPPPSSSS